MNWYVLRRFLSILFSGVAFLLWICLARITFWGDHLASGRSASVPIACPSEGFHLIDTRKIGTLFGRNCCGANVVFKAEYRFSDLRGLRFLLAGLVVVCP